MTRVRYAAGAVLLAVVVGCKEPLPPLPATYPVTGSVVSTKGGWPAAGGTVQFSSADDPSVTITGEIQSDGSFTLTTMTRDYRKVPGAVAGKHTVTILPPMSGDQAYFPVTLPGQVTVEPKDNVYRFEVGKVRLGE